MLKQNAKLELLASSFRLREAAEENDRYYQTFNSEEKASLAERAKTDAAEQQKAIKAEIAELSKTIKSVKDINGIPITEKDGSCYKLFIQSNKINGRYKNYQF